MQLAIRSHSPLLRSGFLGLVRVRARVRVRVRVWVRVRVRRRLFWPG